MPDDISQCCLTGPADGTDDLLAQVNQLRALGVIDSATASGVAAAIAGGDAGIVLRWVNELGGAETDAAFYGLDGDVRALREGLAARIGQRISVPATVQYGVRGTALAGDRATRQRDDYTRIPAAYGFAPNQGLPLSIDAEYNDPNLLAGAEEGLLYDRFGRPLSARAIVGHTSLDSGNQAITPDRLMTMFDDLGVVVAASVARRQPDTPDTPYEAIDIYGNPIPDDLDLVDAPGVTIPDDETGLPRMVVYNANLGEGTLEQATVIAHEAGHVIEGFLPAASVARLNTMLAESEDAFNELNNPGYLEVYKPDAQPYESIGDAIRAYLLYPDWFKTYYPGLADAIAEEVGAAPALQGIVQFN